VYISLILLFKNKWSKSTNCIFCTIFCKSQGGSQIDAIRLWWCFDSSHYDCEKWISCFFAFSSLNAAIESIKHCITKNINC